MIYGESGAKGTGYAEVKNGKVLVTDPPAGGSKAVISPGRNVTVQVNGQSIDGPVAVGADDRIVVDPQVVDPSFEVKVTISADKMAAVMKLIKKRGYTYLLEDQEPSAEIVIDAAVKKEMDLPEISPEILVEELEKRGITYGIDKKALEELASAGEEAELVVAKGQPFIRGTDAQVTVVYTETRTQKQEGASVFGERPIANVEAGDLLVIRIPPQPGSPGMNIYGQEVKPPKPKDFPLIAGPGVRLEEDGTRAVATISGRAEFQGGRIAVYPVYQVDGDADIKNGHIKFNGDLLVRGNVLEGMVIEARGRVEIMGYASGCTIISGEDVIIHKSVVGSKIQAGGSAVTYARIKQLTESLLSQARQLLSAFRQMERSARKKAGQAVPAGILLKVLMENKFKELPAMIDSLVIQLKEVTGQVNKELTGAMENSLASLTQKLKGRGPLEVKSSGDLEYLVRAVAIEGRQFLQDLKSFGSEAARIVVPYVQNCQLEASGNIEISGKGCYNSTLYSNGQVLIKGMPGVFRGGRISALGGVEIRELGSPAETRTFVEVPKDAKIKAHKAYPGVTVKSGARQQNLTFPVESLNFTAEKQ